jgi:Tfp pilus assembly protein PilF
LEKAIRICPGYTQPRLKLARLYYENSDLQKCLGFLNEGLTIDQHSWEMWELLAVIQLNLGYPDRAKAAIEEAATLTRKEPTVYYNLGLIQYRLGNFYEAAEALEQSIKLTKNPDAYYLLGLCAEQRNDTSAAIQYYQNCIVSATDYDNSCAQEAKKNYARLQGIDR